MIVDIVDKYRTDDNNPIKNLRLKKKKYQKYEEINWRGQNCTVHTAYTHNISTI